jgi:hypothetical protein
LKRRQASTGLHGATTQEKDIFILAAMLTLVSHPNRTQVKGIWEENVLNPRERKLQNKTFQNLYSSRDIINSIKSNNEMVWTYRKNVCEEKRIINFSHKPQKKTLVYRGG